MVKVAHAIANSSQHFVLSRYQEGYQDGMLRKRRQSVDLSYHPMILTYVDSWQVPRQITEEASPVTNLGSFKPQLVSVHLQIQL